MSNILPLFFDQEDNKFYVKEPVGQDMGGWMAVWDYKFVDITDKIKLPYQKVIENFGWHSVKEDLPPYDEEVIVLTDCIHDKLVPGSNYLCFGHRPNPNSDAKLYDGWNIPGIHHWMYCPKLNGKNLKDL